MADQKSGGGTGVADAAGTTESVFTARPTSDHAKRMKVLVGDILGRPGDRNSGINLNAAVRGKNTDTQSYGQRALSSKVTEGAITNEMAAQIIEDTVKQFRADFTDFTTKVAELSRLPRGTTGTNNVTFGDALLAILPADRAGAREKVSDWLGNGQAN